MGFPLLILDELAYTTHDRARHVISAVLLVFQSAVTRKIILQNIANMIIRTPSQNQE